MSHDAGDSDAAALPTGLPSRGRRTAKKRPPPEAAPRDLNYPRKRALRACHLCRVRKTKCDNVQPTCGSCTTLGTACRFDDGNDHSSFDLASLEILKKLGHILAVQSDLVAAVRGSHFATAPPSAPVLPSSSVAATASQSPVAPSSWYVHAATADAAGAAAAVQPAELGDTPESSIVLLAGYPGDEDATPLQRATKIVDDRQPGQLDPWTERLASPPDDDGLPGRHPEERFWRADEDIGLLPQEGYYLDVFVSLISKWIDLFDPSRQFCNVVPQLALRNAGLMNAVCALACRHLSLHPGVGTDTPAWNVALQYYDQTLHYVQKAMRYETYQTSHELLATTLLVSLYEMLDGSRTAWERHLEGACWILRSRITAVESADFKSAVWWAWLRQDVWAAFSEKRNTFTAWTPEKPYAALSAHEVASRAVWIMAQVVDFCSRAAQVAADSVVSRRLQRARELRGLLREWRQHQPAAFVPRPAGDDSCHAGAVFQALCVQTPCFGTAVQLHHASQILLSVNEPTVGGIESFMARQAAVQDAIAVICGIAMTLTDDASSLISSQAVFIAGMFTQETGQRDCILELLEACRQRTGWSPRFCGQDLKGIWSQAHASVCGDSPEGP